ncbi:restriction endonuclease subunit S [Micromonospora purpureochromogenes]|uniref:restriction endonuclease subunit S n=1 Tax=Micromonospora purpureochromogenes TaxID=47872 RepID=UPI0033E7587A
MSLASSILSTAVNAAPAGWERRRLRDLVHLVNGYPFPSESFGSEGDVPLVRIRDLLATDFETYVSGEVPSQAIVRDGDVVIGMDGDFNVAVWRRGAAALNQRLCLLRPREAVDMRFIAYALPSVLKVINDLTFSTTVKHLASSDLLNERLLIPPLVEQRRIVEFLDKAAGRLEQIHATCSTQQALLLERRRAFIEELLAQDIGTPKSIRMQFVGRPSFEAGQPKARVLSVYRDHGVVPKDSRGDNFNKTPDDLTRYLVVRPNDIVINKMKAWQGSIAVSTYHGIVSPDYLVVRPRSGIFEPTYLHYALRSPRMTAEYATRSVGIRPSQWRLYWEGFKEICVPVPGLPIQRSVVKRMREEDKRVESLISTIRRRSLLVQERRHALIASAVTGQIDVTTAQGGAV